MLLAVCHSRAGGWNEVEDLATLSELRSQRGNLLWAVADGRDLDRSDIETLADEFDLHSLAVEDAMNPRQRPKLDHYEPGLFLTVHQLDAQNGHLEPSQISCFIGERYVITIHDGGQRTIDEATRRWRDLEGLEEDAGYLLHTILDSLVDDYQVKADALEEEIEQLEDLLLSDPLALNQRRVYSVKQRLARLRRYALPLRHVMASLIGLGKDRFQPAVIELFRDVQDHLLRISDQVDNVEELSDAVIDLQRSAEANRLNQVTKRLTAWAAIIAVPTLISGIYGMNVGIVPVEGSRSGFWAILAIMFVVCASMYWYFKKKEWI